MTNIKSYFKIEFIVDGMLVMLSLFHKAYIESVSLYFFPFSVWIKSIGKWILGSLRNGKEIAKKGAIDPGWRYPLSAEAMPHYTCRADRATLYSYRKHTGDNIISIGA